MKKETKEKIEKVSENVGKAMDMANEKVAKPAFGFLKGYEVPVVISILFMLIVGVSMKMLMIGAIVLAVTTMNKWLPIVLAKIESIQTKKNEEVVVTEEKNEEVVEEKK